MTTVDKVFRNGKIVTPFGIFSGGVAVNEGKIVALGLDSGLPKGDVVIDLENKVVFPGIIDNHVHFGDQTGDPDREDYASGTMAAAASGVTLICDMPTGNPGVLNAEMFEEKRKYAEKNAYIDFALYGGAGSENSKSLQGMADAGCVAFKTYMVGTSGFSCSDDGKILGLLKTAASIGIVTTWHCENGALIDPLIEKMKADGRLDPMAHVDSRPNYTEYEAISKLLILNRIADAKLHIIHLSTKEGLELIKSAKAEGMRVTAETCPHYLLATSSFMNDVGPYAKIIPPLRSEEDRHAMWKGLKEGIIDYICSDHAPHSKKNKDAGFENIWLAGNGNPGVETLLPLMLDQVNKKNLNLQQIAYFLSTRPSQVFDLYPKKGSMLVGSDADLTVVDMNEEWIILPEKLYSKSRETSMFNGWRVKGKPILTVVRGEIVAKNGVVVGNKGYGKFQKRLLNPIYFLKK